MEHRFSVSNAVVHAKRFFSDVFVASIKNHQERLCNCERPPHPLHRYNLWEKATTLSIREQDRISVDPRTGEWIVAVEFCELYVCTCHVVQPRTLQADYKRRMAQQVNGEDYTPSIVKPSKRTRLDYTVSPHGATPSFTTPSLVTPSTSRVASSTLIAASHLAPTTVSAGNQVVTATHSAPPTSTGQESLHRKAVANSQQKAYKQRLQHQPLCQSGILDMSIRGCNTQREDQNLQHQQQNQQQQQQHLQQQPNQQHQQKHQQQQQDQQRDHEQRREQQHDQTLVVGGQPLSLSLHPDSDQQPSTSAAVRDTAPPTVIIDSLATIPEDWSEQLVRLTESQVLSGLVDDTTPGITIPYHVEQFLSSSADDVSDSIIREAEIEFERTPLKEPKRVSKLSLGRKKK